MSNKLFNSLQAMDLRTKENNPAALTTLLTEEDTGVICCFHLRQFAPSHSHICVLLAITIWET